MQLKNYIYERLDFFALLFLSAVLIFFNIHKLPIIDGDTAYYSKIAKNILETGNWLTFKYVDPMDIIDKPPLAFWPIAISFILFGINNFAAIFWHGFFALAAVWLTYLTAYELFGRKTAFYSGLILITMAQFFYQTRIPLQDMPLTFLTVGTLFSVYLFTKYRLLRFYYLAVILFSLAILFKGPLSVALIAPIIAIYLLVGWILPFEKPTDYIVHGLFGLLIFVLLGCGWYIYQYGVWGQPFIDKYFARNVGRYFKPVDGWTTEVQHDYYAYFLGLLVMTLPWAGFLYPATYYAIRKWKEYKKEFGFLLSWFLFILLFFTISGNRTIFRYLLPVYPAIAIIIGKLFNDIFEQKEKFRGFINTSLAITIVLTLPFLVVLVYYQMVRFPEEYNVYLPIFLPLIFIFSLALLAFLVICFMKKYKTAFYTLIALISIAYLVFIWQGTIYFPKLQPYESFGKQVNNFLAQNDGRVGRFMVDHHQFVDYYVDAPVSNIETEEQLLNFIRSHEDFFIISDNKQAVQKLIDQKRLFIINQKHKTLLLSNKK